MIEITYGEAVRRQRLGEKVFPDLLTIGLREMRCTSLRKMLCIMAMISVLGGCRDVDRERAKCERACLVRGAEFEHYTPLARRESGECWCWRDGWPLRIW